MAAVVHLRLLLIRGLRLPSRCKHLLVHHVFPGNFFSYTVPTCPANRTARRFHPLVREVSFLLPLAISFCFAALFSYPIKRCLQRSYVNFLLLDSGFQTCYFCTHCFIFAKNSCDINLDVNQDLSKLCVAGFCLRNFLCLYVLIWRVILGVKTWRGFLCFLRYCFAVRYCLQCFVFFVLRHS